MTLFNIEHKENTYTVNSNPSNNSVKSSGHSSWSVVREKDTVFLCLINTPASFSLHRE